MRSAALGLALALAMGALALSAARAQDLPRCAVMPLEGRSTVVVRRSLMRALRDHGAVEVIDEDEIDAIVERGGDAAEVAERTGATLIVGGSVEGRGARRRLRLVASDASGRELARGVIRLRRGGAGRRALLEGIEDLLEAAVPAAEHAARERARARDEEAARRRDEADEEDEEADEEDEGEPTAFGAPARIVTVRVGAVVRTRDAEVVLVSGSARSWHADPAYVEGWGGAEVRPFARDESYARGLFLRADFAVAVGLGSVDDRGMPVETSFFRFAGDVGYLFPAGEVVEVGLGLGGGMDAYQLGANVLFPGVELSYVRPALRARVRAVGEAFVISAELGYRGIVARSGLPGAFGSAGGDSHGIDFGGGLSGAIDVGDDVGGLAWSLDVSWVGVWHTFSGTGTLGAGDRGTEQGVRGLVSLGWSL